MKQLASLLFILLFAISGASAKDRVSPHTTVKEGNISITYGRPYKKDRVIFGDGDAVAKGKALEAYGKVWRTGADEATEITFDKDCTFAGKPVKAGTYSLFTIPGKDTWTVILNSKLGQWGAFAYAQIRSNDVLTATVPAQHLDKVVEQLTFTIQKSGAQPSAVKLEWDQTSISIPVSW